MGLFDRFRTWGNPTVEVQDRDDEDDYVVETLVPTKVPNTTGMLLRQREEELRRKYCKPSVKTGYLA